MVEAMTDDATVAPAGLTAVASLLTPFYPHTPEGKPTFAPRLATIVAHEFPDTAWWEAGLLSRDRMMDEPTKEYLAVSDMEAFIEVEVGGMKRDHHLNEVLAPNRPVRPYFDLEWDPAALHGGNEVETLYHAMLAVAQALERVGFCPGRGLAVFCASGPSSTFPSGRKASYHVLCDMEQVFRNVVHHKQFMDNLLLPLLRSDSLGDHLYYTTGPTGAKKCVFDSVPYMSHQNFRLPYQSKWTSSAARCLVPFDGDHFASLGLSFSFADIYTVGVYEDPDTLTYMKWEPQEVPRRPPFIRHRTSITAVEASNFLLIHALTELLTVEFLSHYEKARNLIWLLWGTEASERMRTLIHDLCAKAPNYSHTWVEGVLRNMTYVGFTLGSLHHWAEECSSKEAVKEVVQKARDLSTSVEDLICIKRPLARQKEVHVRYLSEALGGRAALREASTLLIESHLGTGKTVAIREILQDPQYRRILLVSPRRTYTYSQTGSLADLGVVSYLDCLSGSLGGLNRIIVQVESLHRLAPKAPDPFEPYDIVVMDESESSLYQLHSLKTNGPHMITNHEILEQVIRTARHVIFADAFLSDRTCTIASHLREESNTLFVKNTYQPYARQAIRLLGTAKDQRVANLDGFRERIMEALRAGRRVVVIWTSKAQGHNFAKSFLEDGPFSYRYYHADSEEEDKAGLRDVHTAWSGLQCLMMTTVVTVGISYDPKVAAEEFDEVFLYGSSASALPRDIAQALLRVRVLKANRLTYVTDTRVGYHGARGVANVRDAITKKEERLMEEHPLVLWKTIPAWARDNYIYNENEVRTSQGEYRQVLEMYLKRSGYQLSTEIHIAKQAIMLLTEDTKKKWEEIDDVEEQQVEEIYRLIRQGEACVDLLWMYKKWVFRSVFIGEGWGREDALRAVWNRFYLTGEEGLFWNVYREKQMTLEEMVEREADKRFAVMVSGQVERRRTMERFLRMAGMAHSQEEVTMGPERLAEIGEALSVAEQEIREGMGMPKSLRKKGEWRIEHTMDLIRCVLENWGGSTIKTTLKKKMVKGVKSSFYTLETKPMKDLWPNLKSRSHINYDEFLIQL